jgi:signal transduction histidine kinase
VQSTLGNKNETGFGIGLYGAFELLKKTGRNLQVDSKKNRETKFSFYYLLK